MEKSAAKGYADATNFDKAREKLAELEKYGNDYLWKVMDFTNSIFYLYIDEYGYDSFMLLAVGGGFSRLLK